MEENKYDNLIRLNKLKEDGTLTEEEFEIEKFKILNNNSNNNTEKVNIQQKDEKKEKDFTKAKPLNMGTKFVNVIKMFFYGLILGVILPLGSGTRIIGGIGFGLGFAIFLIFAYAIQRPIEGKCPYCGAEVWSSNKIGFDCVSCKKRIVVRNNNEFHKID